MNVLHVTTNSLPKLTHTHTCTLYTRLTHILTHTHTLTHSHTHTHIHLIAGVWLLQHRRFWHFSQAAEGGQADVHRFWGISGEEVSNQYSIISEAHCHAYSSMVWCSLRHSLCMCVEGGNDGYLCLDTLGYIHQTWPSMNHPVMNHIHTSLLLYYS